LKKKSLKRTTSRSRRSRLLGGPDKMLRLAITTRVGDPHKGNREIWKGKLRDRNKSTELGAEPISGAGDFPIAKKEHY